MATKNNQIPPSDSPELISGDSETIQITVKDEDDNVKDISGSTVKFKAYDKNDNVVIDKQTGGSGINIQGSNNEIINITLDPSDTKDLGKDENYFDYECEVDDSGTIQTVSYGKLKIVQDRIS